MNIHVSREASITNPLKNNLRPLPQIDNRPFIEIDDQTTVLVLDGPVEFHHNGRVIPFWIVRVLEGNYRNAAGWMAEINQSGADILVGL
jgi:hypothetical protein